MRGGDAVDVPSNSMGVEDHSNGRITGHQRDEKQHWSWRGLGVSTRHGRIWEAQDHKGARAAVFMAGRSTDHGEADGMMGGFVHVRRGTWTGRSNRFYHLGICRPLFRVGLSVRLIRPSLRLRLRLRLRLGVRSRNWVRC